jgi:DNA invertase Pin-like site-specific DNA recombinase
VTRAIGYARVSTAEQVNGFGLDVQRQAITEHCRAHGLDLIHILADEGQSGAKGIEARPGLARALAEVESTRSVLVVYRADRLARDLVLQETIIARLRAAGASIVSISEPDIDSGDPTRVLVRQVLGAIAQYERALIAARTAAGRAAKRAAGGYAGGRPRYGTAAREGALVPAHQATIARARVLRSQGLSLRQLAEALEAEGHRSAFGRHWGLATLARMVAGDAS